MIPVTRDHLPQLFQAVPHDGIGRLRSHPFEGAATPGGDFGLDQDAVVVAVVEYAAVLLPVNARVDAVQLLHVRVIMRDPCGGFRHTELRIAARHALHAHQAHALAVQIKGAVARLDPAHAESFRVLMAGAEGDVQR